MALLLGDRLISIGYVEGQHALIPRLIGCLGLVAYALELSNLRFCLLVAVRVDRSEPRHLG